ncbi:MAG: type IV pilus assembly protein PilM [Elusimicrobiota bacterium]|jgi:type IV pilus assembly protein PilM
MLNFFKRKQDLLGVDIGTFAIKLVCLKKQGGQWSLMHWGVIPYGDDLPLDTPLIDRKGQAIMALQNYLRTTALPSQKSVTSVSGNSVIVRYVKMNKMPAAELAKSIKFEAEPYIPFNIEDVNISFDILGDLVEEGQSQMETLLVAAKKDSVELRVDVLKEAGLQPVIVDVDAFALENAYEQVFPGSQSETVLFLNIGASFTNMSIVEKGVSRVVRDVFIAGNTFTKAIQRQFQCDVKTAEQKKLTYGLVENASDPEAQQTTEALLPVARDLITEVQRSIDFYLSQGTDRLVNKIFLCGGSANLKMLDTLLANELKIQVEIFNPLPLLQNPPTDLTEEQQAQLPQLAVALGLATRRVKDGVA